MRASFRLFCGISFLLLSGGLLCGAAKPAETFTEPLQPVKGNRARVLVLDDRVDRAEIERAQKIFADEAYFFVPTQRADGKAPSLKDYLGKHKRKWDILYLDPEFRGLADTFPGNTKEEKIKAFIAEAQNAAIVPAVIYDPVRMPTLEQVVRLGLFHETVAPARWPAGETRDPARLAADPEAFASPKELPVLPCETATVYQAQAGGWQFNMHPFIAFYEGQFWAIFSSCQVDEDGPGQIIRYATSADGLTWGAPKILAADPDGPEGKQRWMPGGLYVKDGKLTALGALHTGGSGLKIWDDLKTYRFEWDGTQWQNKGVFAEDCLVYFPPLAIGENREFLVWRNRYGHLLTATSAPGGGDWKTTPLPGPLPEYRMSETSSFVDADGVIHLIIRDQGYTMRLYHSVSFDNGKTWTIPVKTNFPDCASKNMSGRLSNGLFYLINNPGDSRDPLTIAVSKDGWMFSNPKIVRVNSPDRRYPGKFKNQNSFQYAHAIEHGGKLWIIYATNKEDIEITAVPVSELQP